ncbi:MAG TPA: DUF5666 domain-containing protein [Vicinamibacterales bacterium]|nr:DUF5666 domain-containing protein [Vicinamibacterales bacterium]
MRHTILAVLLLGAVTASSAWAAAPQTASTAKSSTKAAKSASTASHSVSGVIKSIDATSMTLSRKKGGDLTFALNPSTDRQGQLAVGSQVSVHYREDGSSHVATAVVAQAAKNTASSTTKAKK